MRPTDSSRSNGHWWSPERTMMQQMIDALQATVNGDVRFMLYKDNVIVAGRQLVTDSLFVESAATFEDNVAYVIY